MCKSNVMYIFSYHFPQPGGVKSFHMVFKFGDCAPLFTIAISMIKKHLFKMKSFPCITKNAAMQILSCGGVELGHKAFWFSKIGRFVIGKVVNHVSIYGSNLAKGFSAFQHWSCLSLAYQNLHHMPLHKYIIWFIFRIFYCKCHLILSLCWPIQEHNVKHLVYLSLHVTPLKI